MNMKRIKLTEQQFKNILNEENRKNYMFFQNLNQIKGQVEELLSMDRPKLDNILSDGHDWASDHITTAKDDVEEVYHFFKHGETIKENKLTKRRVIPEDYNKKVWEFRISYNNAKDNIEEIFNDVMDTDEINNPEKAKDIMIDIIHQVYDEYNEQSIDDDEDNDDDTSMEIRGIGKYLDDDDESPKSVMGAIKYGLTPKIRRK